MKHACVFFLLVVACGDDDRNGLPDASTDAMLSDVAAFDASTDSGGVDASVGDAGDAEAADVPGADASSLAMVELTFGGCAPDLMGGVVVVRNADSISVSSTRGGGGSIQFALQDERGNVSLGTQHRVDTGAVINVTTTSTWTNIAMDSSGVLSGDVADPIGGTLDVAVYDESAGMLDVTFTTVTLQNPGDGTICQVDGRLRTSGLSF